MSRWGTYLQHKVSSTNNRCEVWVWHIKQTYMTHDCKALIINNIKELLHHQDENKLTLDNLNRQNFGFPLRPYLSNWEPFFKATRALKNTENKSWNKPIKFKKPKWDLINVRQQPDESCVSWGLYYHHIININKTWFPMLTCNRINTYNTKTNNLSQAATEELK